MQIEHGSKFAHPAIRGMTITITNVCLSDDGPVVEAETEYAGEPTRHWYDADNFVHMIKTAGWRLNDAD